MDHCTNQLTTSQGVLERAKIILCLPYEAGSKQGDMDMHETNAFVYLFITLGNHT